MSHSLFIESLLVNLVLMAFFGSVFCRQYLQSPGCFICRAMVIPIQSKYAYPSTTSMYLMTFRLRDGIHKPTALIPLIKHLLPQASGFHYLLHLFLNLQLLSKLQRIPRWVAMKEKHSILLSNNTSVWFPPGSSFVGCDWVFRVEECFESSIEQFMARLVAKGNN